MANRFILSFLLLFSFVGLRAQETSYYLSGMGEYQKALELFEKEKYAEASSVFEDYIKKQKDKDDIFFVNAHYYRALCATKLFNSDAEFLISHFLVQFPESPKVKALYFVMGNFQYQKKKYQKAIKWYEKIDVYDLTEEKKQEYYFKLGYSYFRRDKMEAASSLFAKIKDTDSKYAVPAKYFYGHIAFEEKKYETALKNFEDLEEDDLFAPIVPYYIVQIYFYQKRYKDVIRYAPALLDSSKTRNIGEISHILGDSYYETHQFEKAIPYLERYKKNTNDFSREDAYQLAYAYYKTENYPKAVSVFSKIRKRKDTITQNTYYHIADCYLKEGNKDRAMLAFQQAYQLDVLPEVKEDAMYNYAKLTYELSYSPFNDAIDAFEEYLHTYKKSPHHDEIYQYLTEVFLSSKNYKKAIKSIAAIKKKTPKIIESFQKVAFYRALELFNDAKFKESIALFNKSIENSKYNLLIRALSKYWRAEAFYKVKKYQKAFDDFNDYVLTSGSYGQKEFKDAHYNMGYCLFKLHRYADALVWFRKYVDFMDPARMDKKADADNRIGDCYFISKQYAFAIDYYKKAIALAQINIDYAMFQKGFSEGLLKKYQDEINTLKDLVATYPSSIYRDDAVYEIANAYELMNDHTSAISYYADLIDKFPHSKYRAKAYLKRALLDYNNNRNDDALLSLKKLVAEYPKTEEAQKALLIMKNIYVDLNKVDDYINFAENNNVETEISKMEKDSLKYVVAENLYMNGNCEESIKAFDKYIQQFPKGRYLLNAHYFKADCAFKNKDYTNALVSYDYVISQNTTEYMEDALLKAASISFNDSDYTRAITYYQKLEQNYSRKSNLLVARVGLMRSYYRLKEYQEAIKSAMRLLPETTDKEALAREVHYVVGNSFYALKDIDAAYPEFSIISDNLKSAYGAEAMYKMIDIEFQRKDYDLAINLIKKFKAAHSPHQYWVAKSFIVWAKIFLLKEDYFMAKATLQSVIKYYPNDADGLKKEAEDNLNNVLDAEEEDAELNEAIDDVEINLNEDAKENKLFEEDSENEK